MKTKICISCKKEKDLSCFGKDLRSLDGLLIYCKKCITEISKKNYLKNKDKILVRNKKYRDTHKDSIKNYFEKHKKRFKKKQKKYQEEHKEEIKKYLFENKKQIAKTAKKYYLKNKEKINKQALQRTLKRFKTDINFKLKICLRGRIWRVLKRKVKSASTLELLGCSVKYLKNYLEQQFTEGMTWDNHGTGHNGKGMEEWHVDHIKPCASFDLSKPEQQKVCFHYTNLQPLWAKENLIKSVNHE